MIKRLDIIEPHDVLLCAPRSRWVVLREGRLAHRAPFRPMSDRSVPRIEPQVEGQHVCTRTIRPRSNVHPKISSSALPVKSKFDIVVFSKDILDSYFHSLDPYRGTVNSSCLRESRPATCFSGPRESLIVLERERNTSLVVSGREPSFSTSFSAGEQGLVLSASCRGRDFSFDVP